MRYATQLWVTAMGTVLSIAAVRGAADSMLPEGSAPLALSASHFPDRVHEFVWRNWNVVPTAKVAAILGGSPQQVAALAASMGLPPAAAPAPEMPKRGYVTLIRRNWHLLPYPQLLALLDMTPERLAFALREDDFLWVKLGRLKPKCEPLRWREPDEPARRRAAEIRRVVEDTFGDELLRPTEPRFAFVRQLSNPPPLPAPVPAPEAPVSLRLVYSYLATYGDPLSDPSLDPYPAGFLQRLSAVGVNGVWLHVVLRDLAPGGVAFPEFGDGHQRRLANLRRLVQRAQKAGVRVYLYLNEPRAMPTAFFANRPEMAGVREEGFVALCTSHPAVRRWMTDALAHIFQQVPDLGGIYAITGSENLTHCASHGAWQSCPRCGPRRDSDILAEVVAALEEGVHRGSPKADVIVSDWGWRGHGDATDIIPRLPKSVWLMSVSEWDLPIQRGGVGSKVGEYSISSVGPGPRSARHWAAAEKAGIKKAAEIQYNNTCEIASIPYLPCMDLIAEHIHRLAPARLDGMLIGWTMGGHPSPNFELAREMNCRPPPAVDVALEARARAHYGTQGAPHARRAWKLASDAFREYPFHVSVVYGCPVQQGPANPLYPTRTGYSATMWGIPYDDLDGWRGPYPAEVFAAQFAKMADAWPPAVDELRRAVEKTPAERRAAAAADLRYAEAAGIHFASVANQASFVLARDALSASGASAPPAERTALRDQMRRRLESEIALARRLYTLCGEDSRIGFEPSCHYFYLPQDLVEKVVNCRWLLDGLRR